MNRSAYWLIAAGYLCVSVNLEVNGCGILLPTALGDLLIACGAYELRDRQRVFRCAWPVALVLAFYSLRYLSRGLVQEIGLHTFLDGLVWPARGLDLLLIALIAAGIWREARRCQQVPLSIQAALVFPVTVLAMTAWWFFPVTDNRTLILSFLIYEIPPFYLAVVSALAARRLGR
jgi:hypothetical protein